MKTSAVALGVGAMLAAGPTLARDHVLLDAGKAPANQTITSKSLGVKSAKPFSVTTKTLHVDGRKASCWSRSTPAP